MWCSPAVGPRSYLGRDEALDYDAMSDLEWVEEPEDGETPARLLGALWGGAGRRCHWEQQGMCGSKAARIAASQTRPVDGRRMW